MSKKLLLILVAGFLGFILLLGVCVAIVGTNPDTKDKDGKVAEENVTEPTADTAPPVISAVAATEVSQEGAKIIWNTDEASTSQVEYGPTSGYGSASPSDANLVASHSVVLSGLTSGTTYHFRVKSKDTSGNEAVSDDNTLITVQSTKPVQILSQSSYLDSLGYYHVVGEVKNNNSRNLGSVKLTATFYDSSGTVVGTDFTYARIDVLVPGQKSPFELTLIDKAVSANVDHYVVMNSDYSLTTQEPYRGFQILSQTPSIDALGYYEVVGEVKNTGNQAATSVRVEATFYDSTGAAIAADFTYTDPNDLTSGQVAPFTLTVLDKNLSAKITSYELQVQS